MDVTKYYRWLEQGAWRSQEHERPCQGRLMVRKATQLSHYSTKKINWRKGMRVRSVYGFQADVTAK